MMAADHIPSVEAYWQQLEAHLPRFLPEEQRVAIALYHELAKGRAVDAAQLGRALGISVPESQALLRRNPINDFAYLDDQGRVLGFGGLATTPMHHQFEIDDRRLSTWCAWDSLFIPEILGRSARIASADPENGELVRVVVSPDRVESAEPADAVVSFVLPDAEAFGNSAANVISKFCHFIFFFTSRRSGERWVARHRGTFLYSLEEAFVLAKRHNARNFGAELARRASSAPSR